MGVWVKVPPQLTYTPAGYPQGGACVGVDEGFGRSCPRRSGAWQLLWEHAGCKAPLKIHTANRAGA